MSSSSSTVVYEGWMVRHGRRKIGRSFIHMRYFVLETRMLSYFKRKPQHKMPKLPIMSLHIDGNCRVEDTGLTIHQGHTLYVLSVYNKREKHHRITMAAFNIQEALFWKEKIEMVIDQQQLGVLFDGNTASVEGGRKSSSSDCDSQLSGDEDTDLSEHILDGTEQPTNLPFGTPCYNAETALRNRLPGNGDMEMLEHILDGREEPTNLPFTFLKDITEHFSEDRVIGQGGFATVYKGILPNGSVAVKRIRNNHTIDEKLFYREVDSLLTINHKNVVRFLGFCASTEQIAIKVEGSRQRIYAEIRERLLCFEYISNGSLREHISDELRGLDWNTRYQIIKGICEGLHHLHKEKLIYHMDLKPANILLDNHMVPKITDFGLARLDEKSQTISENRCGSLGYCAPEYLRSGRMSFKSDMFSLGIIIIELVTGDKSIPDNDIKNVLRRWRHRWKKSGNETPLVYQQVAKCMEIGLTCQEIDPSKRPFIWDMIHDIREMEGLNGTISNVYEYTFGQIGPYSEDDMLGVEPLELHFPFELNKQISCSLKVTNQTDAYIAFNIETMSPLPYCIQPNKDIVPPRSKCSVQITLQAQDKAPRDMKRADEFIVWSVKVNDGLTTEDITTNMFSKKNGVVDAVKLDVVFIQERAPEQMMIQQLRIR